MLRQELKIVPLTAWMIALLVYGGFVVLSSQVIIPRDPELSPWPTVPKILFSFGIPLVLAILVLLIGYVYADARRRGMRYVLWTLLAIFIPNGIGIILYFILRDPLLQACPNCGALVPIRFELEWLHCAHCGASLRSDVT